jgi:hypothetical protein
MLTTWIAAIISRDLRALRREIEAYADERDLWRVAPGISNCGGTLALHLAGNIQFFLGTVLGATGYVRDRDAEFGRRDVPRAELLREIDAALAAVERGAARLTDAALSQPYPQPPGGFAVTTGDFLLHLVAHLTYTSARWTITAGCSPGRRARSAPSRWASSRPRHPEWRPRDG